MISAGAAEIQHMQKALQQMNLHLHHVVSDISGVSGLRIIDAILAGQRDPGQLAKLRDRRVKRLPVVNSTRHLIGIVSRSDVLSTFARPDAEIRQEAAEEAIAESFLADSQPVTVTVPLLL